MKELLVVTAAVTICCIGAFALPTRNLDNNELESGVLRTRGSPLDNWSPDSGVNPDEIGYFVEGDMDVAEDYARNGLVDEKFRWPNGIVPYSIEGDFQEKHLVKIHTAFETYANVTNGCIRFVQQTDEEGYIKIKSESSGCHSTVGYHGGAQTVNLDTKGCLSKIGVILHELYHALGFHHEQSRFDRDEYVTINWDNIKEGGNANFKIVEEDKATGFGLPYDYASVMHYGRFSYHAAPGLETITPFDPEAVIGQRVGLSEIDVGKLMKMYKCDEKE